MKEFKSQPNQTTHEDLPEDQYVSSLIGLIRNSSSEERETLLWTAQQALPKIKNPILRKELEDEIEGKGPQQ